MIQFGILLVLATCYVYSASSCTCTKEYAPQCASDGVTYANPCLLRCARARTGRQLTATPGPCRHKRELRSPCACASIYAPVCANDANTYPNECVLNCAKSKNENLHLVAAGKCPEPMPERPPCICTFDYKPVCGSDGKSYANRCQLDCAASQDPSLRMVSEGKCRDKRAAKPCICTMEYNPVTVGGKTYPNICAAYCRN